MYFCRQIINKTTMYLKLLIITAIALAFAFAAIAIKMFVKKDGEFKKQCSSVDPNTGKKMGCTCSGTPGDGSCKDDKHKHHHHDNSAVLKQIEELKID